MNDNTPLGPDLKTIRDSYELSQEQMARRVGVTLRQYQRWEADPPAEPMPLYRERLAEVLAELEGTAP